MNNSLFSLIIVPDSGSNVKTESFNFKVILGFFTTLIIIFLICLFFIMSYHIKLSQEKNYKNSVSNNRKLLNQVEKSKKKLNNLSKKMSEVQRNDKAFRLINNMSIIDDEMYKAGIGGHVIVNDNEFATLNEELRVKLTQFAYNLTSLESRIYVENKSLNEIQSTIQTNFDRINNTPSILPTRFIRITSSYGWRRHPLTGSRDFHGGVDLAGARGQPIAATADGVVTFAGWRGRLGRTIVVTHKYGYETLYGHLTTIIVKVGQTVKKHQLIGTMGSSGNTTGVHLHYGVLLNDRAQNPMKYFL